MTTKDKIIWMWDTEYDKKQAEQLEKRVKQKIIEEIEKSYIKIVEKEIKELEELLKELSGEKQQ